MKRIENTKCAEPGVDITAVTKLKHADLWEAAKHFGSQTALAKHLGITPSELCKWINLQACPPLKPTGKRWTKEHLEETEAKLLALTGKLLEDLFPPELRDNVQFLHAPKTFEQTRRIERNALEHYAAATAARLTNQAAGGDPHKRELAHAVAQALSGLTLREREIVKLRYGLGDAGGHTLSETCRIFGITRERVRQIEARAIRKLQRPHRAAQLAGFLE